MERRYQLTVQVFDEGTAPEVVALDDGSKIGNLKEIEARKAELERIFPNKRRHLYEIRPVQ